MEDNGTSKRPFQLPDCLEFIRISDTEIAVKPRSGFIFRFGDEDNYTQFNSYGHQTMVGNAKVWDDQRTDATNLKTSGTGVSLNTTESTIDFLKTATLSDYALGNLQLSHEVDVSSVIYPHLHFFAALEGVVPNFLLQYRWQKIGGTKVTSWTNYKCNTLALTAPAAGVTQHNIATGAGITPPAGAGISDVIQYRIYRDSANASGVFAGADPYNATVALLSFDTHVEYNSLGSDTQYQK